MVGRTLARALGVAVLLALAAPAAAPAADELIQPGAIIFSSVGQCTMNFVFSDAGGQLYIGTAGHCSSAIGERMRTVPGPSGAFGSVVFREYGADVDFTLIQVDAGKPVNPSVRFWTGPTGYTTASETPIGDPIALYGYGTVFGSNPNTRPRPGVLQSDDANEYVADTGAVFGDSGGPLIELTTGKALGTISRFALDRIPPATDVGPTVEHILARLAGAGFAVSLVTAPYQPPG